MGRHGFGADASHTREDFAATLNNRGRGAEGPGGKVSRARVTLFASAGQASSLRIVTPPSSSPTTLKPCRS
jgi:hypothetical protein